MKYANGTNYGTASISGSNFGFFLDDQPTWKWYLWHALYIITIGGLITMIMREGTQCYKEKWQYLRSVENCLEVFFILCMGTYVGWVPFAMEYEQIFGSVSVFLALIDLNIMLGTHPKVGTYSYIAICQLRLFIKFFTIFSFTLLAVAISLHLFLVRDYKLNGVFDNPWTSFLKVPQSCGITLLEL